MKEPTQFAADMRTRLVESATLLVSSYIKENHPSYANDIQSVIKNTIKAAQDLEKYVMTGKNPLVEQ